MTAELDQALGRLGAAELGLADAFGRVASRHRADPDVFHLCNLFAEQCRDHAGRLLPRAQQEGAHEPTGFDQPESEQPGLLLLSHLRLLYLEVQTCWIDATIARQAVQAQRDGELLEPVSEALDDLKAQSKWLLTRIKTTAPQALS